MNATDFEKICKELLDKSNSTLFNKSHEYATDEDRLANFRQPTKMMGVSQAEVCLMYQMKHISSIAKIAKESSRGVLPTKELLQEKCQDMLNYTLLFYANMMELIDKAQAPQGIAVRLNSETGLSNDPDIMPSTQTEHALSDTQFYEKYTNFPND